MPTVSAVVANYNHARFLPDCLNAIEQQDDLLEEVILIDDGSTDDSLSILRRFASARGKWRLIPNPRNTGIIKVMNQGLHEAKSDYIMFCAADDWILVTFVERCIALIERFDGAGVCSAQTLVCNESGRALRPLATGTPLREAGYISPQYARRLFEKDESWIVGNAGMFSRRATLEFGGFREELGSSCDDFIARQLSLAYGACFIPEPLAVWRRVSNSYSASTHSDLTRMRSILDRFMELASVNYANLFTPLHIRRWADRWLYRMCRAALADQLADMKVLQVVLPELTPGERKAILAVRQRRFLRVVVTFYLFIRFRGRDIPNILGRRAYRLRRAFSARLRGVDYKSFSPRR